MVDNRVACNGISCKDCALYLCVADCKYMAYVDLTLRADWYILHETNIDVSLLD